jgi:hypothetical protein
VDKLDLLRHRLSLRIDEREAEGGGEESATADGVGRHGHELLDDVVGAEED